MSELSLSRECENPKTWGHTLPIDLLNFTYSDSRKTKWIWAVEQSQHSKQGSNVKDLLTAANFVSQKIPLDMKKLTWVASDVIDMLCWCINTQLSGWTNDGNSHFNPSQHGRKGRAHSPLRSSCAVSFIDTQSTVGWSVNHGELEALGFSRLGFSWDAWAC